MAGMLHRLMGQWPRRGADGVGVTSDADERPVTTIPGMTEAVEQRLLFELAESASLGSSDIVCEVGSYLGRSARCLAEGLLANPEADLSKRRSAALHAYDVFSCAADGALARCVVRDVRSTGLSDLLVTTERRLDFSRVFDHHMSHLPPGLVERHQVPIALAKHDGAPIALMHVDAPKWYGEYRQVLSAFGPHLTPGARVVLQDYFYHWSADLIAAVQLLIEDGVFEPLATAASSLLVRVSRPVGDDELKAVDGRLDVDHLGELLDRAIRFFERFDMYRKPRYLPRLFLAGMQHDFERGRFDHSSRWLARVQDLVNSVSLSPEVLSDLADLARYGFSMRTLYEADIEGSGMTR